ncbi:hypothetical protein [Rhodococcus opacus]|nr:hypothetical protein [Rhodococcus opacus]MDJ0418230.1 hypothetical protein [Rhodococcus opacus]MDX5968164.1 hypothetical protein [Rhodococcus opacus]CAG7588218.1 hypothetical protein E143388_02969 [Rhodococcus opacus]
MTGVVLLINVGTMLLLVGAFGSGGMLGVAGVLWFGWLYRASAR